jgi:hypothetical protein
MIIRFFTTNQKKFEDQLSELWTVDSGLLTIIRRGMYRYWANGIIADNHNWFYFFHCFLIASYFYEHTSAIFQ